MDSADFQRWVYLACDLMSDVSATVGMRAVARSVALFKLEHLCLAGVWRSWDVARVCLVIETSENYYIAFHIRGIALHGALYLHYHDHSAVPPWICTLASALPAQCEGTLPEVDAISLAVQSQASLQEGVVQMTWLDIVGRAIS